MQVLLATLCDSAADYQGKLSLLGAFDTLCARELPVIHPQCALALRICYDPADVGGHRVTIRCLDPDDAGCLPPFDQVIDVAFPSAFIPFVTRNIVLNLQRVKFEKPGLYRFVVESDGREIVTIPLRVTLFDETRSATGPGG
ncbi:MAG: hypothetical protein K1X78_13875 [Verrucomicrobiaceae bacterium]|nr:hypothetical protein [Verrucomicrobiaceae bacterium]